MADDYTPLGMLLSFTSGTTVVDFADGESFIVSFPDVSVVSHAEQVGSPGLLDLDGAGPASDDGSLWVYTWNTLPDAGTPSVNTTPAGIEIMLNTLRRMKRQVNSDGTTGAVGTLVCERWDSSGHPTASAHARLVSIIPKTIMWSYAIFELHFFIAAGGFN